MMTVKQLSEQLMAKVIAGAEGLDEAVEGGYCGDLLSWVMGRAKEHDAWITVMGNLNSLAVAVLAGISCIILAESAPLDDDARARADLEGIPVLWSELPVYDLACRLGTLLS